MDNSLNQAGAQFMLDRVVELIPDKSITAIKNVSMNEAFFEGHFPQMPVMPGVLIVEAMSAAAKLLYFSGRENPDDPQLRLRSVKVKFTNPVFPGDQLMVTVTRTAGGGPVHFIAEARIGEKQAARAELTLGADQ